MVTTSQSRPRKRLVSFLGTGRYEPTRHRFPDGNIGGETSYVCRALTGHVAADEIAIVATAEAEQTHREKLVKELRAANLPAPDFHPIPKGASEPELWQQFEIVKGLLRPPVGTEVVLDVTHAFRSQPFFAAAVTAFVRAVDRQPAPIRLYYAAFEARDGEGVTPVWDLTPFIDLLDWTQAIMLLLRTGRSAGIAKRTTALGRELARRWAETREGPPPNLRKLGEALREFGGNLETVRVGDLLLGKTGSAAAMLDAIRAARETAAAMPPLADVLDRVQHDIVEPLLGASDNLANEAGHQALAGLARLYLQMGRWAEAAAVVREGWITRYATPAAALGRRNQQRPSVDETARRDAEERWNAKEGNAARRIAAVRNDIEHAGFKVQPGAADDLQRDLCRLVDKFVGLPAAVARVTGLARASVFVNLSSHPSADWSEAQRQAALQLAPEIRDLPFPEVPPEAGIADIAALADRVVDRLKREFPGATHAMVQGEFTLAHVLVRRLQQIGIVCLAATTRRDVVEQSPDTKTTRFSFVRFREYG
jgi:CRISPR-associated protein Csx16